MEDKKRMKIQVYGSHKAETNECIHILRRITPNYMETNGTNWPSPTAINRAAISEMVVRLRQKESNITKINKQKKGD